MDRTLNYPKGSILVLTSGEYSDYGMVGYVVTVEDCDLRALAQEYRNAHKPANQWDRPDPDGFVAWLVVNGYAMPVDASTVHLGSYGELMINKE